jgi:hypothetical protein
MTPKDLESIFWSLLETIEAAYPDDDFTRDHRRIDLSGLTVQDIIDMLWELRLTIKYMEYDMRASRQEIRVLTGIFLNRE